MFKSKNSPFFSTTRWTMILRAVGPAEKQASLALEELCRQYWFPIYAYVRGRGYGREDAEDMTQGFFHQILKRNDLSKLREEQGRFRSFLLASLKHYMANTYDRRTSLKRGGGDVPLSLDWEGADMKFEVMDTSALAPDAIYDRQWAMELLKRVLILLRQEWEHKGKADFFDSIKDFLTIEKPDALYGQAALELGMTVNNLRVVTHRLRKRYRELLKDEISRTLADPGMVDEELKTLMEAFG